MATVTNGSSNPENPNSLNKTTPGSASTSRGSLIVLEGVDRSGKSTQCQRLVDYLNATGRPASLMRFPDRTTTIGNMINSYLSNTAEIDDGCIHLLFSANRWEKKREMEQMLDGGTTLIVDRYAFSGVAFTAAKGVKGMDRAWCMGCDVGLLAPDAVLFLSLSAEEQERRGNFGEERYENRDLQARVREQFDGLKEDYQGRWETVDASGTMDEVFEGLKGRVDVIVGEDKGPLGRLWEGKRCIGEIVIQQMKIQMQRTSRQPGTKSLLRRAQVSAKRGSSQTTVTRSSASRELLAAGKVKYESGDRMGALKLWEEIASKGPTQQERVTSAYNQTCVHASFGDLELAQITLRDAVLEGLDFKQMLDDPIAFDEDAVKLRASQQVLIRLKKFSEAALKAAEERKSGASVMQKREKQRSTGMSTDLSETLSTDMVGIDTSIVGIIRRVLLLLLALSVGGVGLWFLGLKYLFDV